MSLMKSIIDYWANLSLVRGYGLDCFEDGFPEDNNVVALFEYSGLPFLDLESSRRSIQINVRNKSYTTAYALSWALYKSLMTEGGIVSLNNNLVGVVYLKQPPFKSDRDDKNRVIFTFNCLWTIKND
jgi:hypothetical protein